MYYSIVSAIASASSSSKYSWSESRLKSGDLNSSRLRVLMCLLDDQNFVQVLYDQYAISNGGGYGILISWDEYTVLDRELDTPYPMEVDTPYSTVDQNSGFLGVGTTLDIFQNIIFIPYLEYGVLSLSGYGVLSFILCGLCTFKKKAPKAIKEIKKFAQKAMGTTDVRVDVKLNKHVWSRGIRSVPRRVRVRIARKRNDDEDAKEELYSLVTVAEIPAEGLKGLGTKVIDDED
ncbi:60S ribosomal protein L31 [Tanacetum coccineum]